MSVWWKGVLIVKCGGCWWGSLCACLCGQWGGWLVEGLTSKGKESKTKREVHEHMASLNRVMSCFSCNQHFNHH